jgi:acyl carrier protein
MPLLFPVRRHCLTFVNREVSSVSDIVRREEVFEAVQQVVSAVLRVPAEQLTWDSKISDLALVESIKLLRIAGKIERRFGIELDNELVFRDGSLGDIAEGIVNLRPLVEDEAC